MSNVKQWKVAQKLEGEFFVKRGREQTATAIAAASATTVDYVIANLPVGPVQAGLKLESLGHSGWDDV